MASKTPAAPNTPATPKTSAASKTSAAPNTPAASRTLLAAGTRVIRTVWPAGRPGRIQTVARVSAKVLWDGESVPEKVYLDGLRPETASDVAARLHRDRMQAWRDERPETTIAFVEHDSSWGGSREEVGVGFRPCRTPDQMRVAAREVAQLADWFDRRPVAPDLG